MRKPRPQTIVREESEFGTRQFLFGPGEDDQWAAKVEELQALPGDKTIVIGHITWYPV